MKVWLIKTGILLIGLFLLLTLPATQEPGSQGKITEFTVVDNPNDDGAGILLSWKPLDDRERVIEYRIYRGVSSDTLFQIGTIEVDPKAGISGDRLYYYDKDYQVLVDMETAPGRLRKEKGVAPGSPLFRQMPRDIKVIERFLPYFTTLGMLKNSAYFEASRQVTGVDGETYAGVPLREFTALLANPIADSTYFYTVLAVNERGRLLPHADIKSAVPVDDRPDTTSVLTTALIPDDNEVYFEWVPSIGSPDIYLWSAWLMPRSLLPAYYAQQELNHKNPYDGNYSAWQERAVPLFQQENSFAPVQYHKLDLKHNAIPLPPNLEDFVTVFGCMDYAGLWAFNLGKDIRIAHSGELPHLPPFNVENEHNNKGDTLVLSFGRPIAYVTKVGFADQAQRRVLINYELSNNRNNEIASIHFQLETPDGRMLGGASDHYLDRIVSLRLPAEFAGIRQFNVRIGFHYKGEKSRTEMYVSQSISFDEENKLFVPSDVFSSGENLSRITYDIASRSRLAADYASGKRIGAISRVYDEIIPFPSDVNKSVYGVDTARSLVNLDHRFTVDVDPESQTPFRASLFRDWFEQDLEQQQNDLNDLKTQLAVRQAALRQATGGYETNRSEIDSLQQVISLKQSMLDATRNNPVYVEGELQSPPKWKRFWRKLFGLSPLADPSPQRWLKLMRRYAEDNSRTVSYKLIVTDGNGLFVESEPLTDAEGKVQWTFPTPDWFDSTKTVTLIGTILFTLLVVFAVIQSRRGKDFYIRPIAGLHEIDNAVGRATEMGRPIMFVPGWGTLGDVCTIASLMILNQVARKSAEYDTRIISPHCDYMVMPLAQEIVKSAYSEAGRPDAFNQNDVFFITYDQFPFAAGVNGITIRERVATVFYMGYFNAEALLMTETGNAGGAIQIAGTDAITQIPFFITTCDYTLMGEEYYAASAYMSQDADLISALKAQDYLKVIIILGLIIGAAFSTLNYTGFINAFPIE